MKHSRRTLALLLAVAFLFPRSSKGVGEDNPTGVTGEFNGNITTGGSYDNYTGNARRVVDDMTVPGSVGKYPLKWTRVINTRTRTGWSSCYGWGMKVRSAPDPTHWNDEDPAYQGPDAWVHYPDGRTVEFYGEPGSWYGAFDSVDTNARLEDLGAQNYDLVLSDGGRVTFRAIPIAPINGVPQYSPPRATSIVDPYGQVTTLERDTSNRLWKIIEPGGRYLEITYAAGGGSQTVIDYVQAFDGRGNLTQMVDYIYELLLFHDRWGLYLTRVNYDDGTYATYTYRASNFPERYPFDPEAIYRGMIETCRDVRYAGAMQNIKYE
jgi:hypothetical protein